MHAPVSPAGVTRFQGDPPAMRRHKVWGNSFVADMPLIVCLCGSTRFSTAFQDAGLAETLAGHIVVTIGAALKSDQEHFGHLPEEERQALKLRLDALHLHKIELADECLILNVGGYVGPSTLRELSYALYCGKTIRFLEPVDPRYLVRVPPFVTLPVPTL